MAIIFGRITLPFWALRGILGDSEAKLEINF